MSSTITSILQHARKIYHRKPWEYVSDQALIAVDDPLSGTRYYCCIMGGAGEHFAVAAYPGSVGLLGYLKTANNEIKPGDFEGMISTQTCLMLSYEDREVLYPEDRTVLKQAGYTARGRHAWPMLRSYQPYHLPWHLTKVESQSFERILEGITWFLAQHPDDFSSVIHHALTTKQIVRIHYDTQQKTWGESIDTITLGHQIPDHFEEHTHDQSKIQKTFSGIKRTDMIWEGDYQLLEEPISETKNGRPFFPLLTLWVDHNSRFIVHTSITKPLSHESCGADLFLAAVKNAGHYPKEIRVRQKKLYQELLPIASQFGIQLTLTTKLPAIAEARRSFTQFFGR